MASVTKISDGKSMADEDGPDDDDQPKKGDGAPRPDKSDTLGYARKGTAGTGGFFSIYKKGQGYWTRMGTVIAAILIGGFTAYTLYVQLPTFMPASPKGATQAEVAHLNAIHMRITVGVTLGFIAGYSWLCWKLLNKPTNVDFLIATDSEMKKVNWTSRRELIGSTRIVIAFMFLIAIFLFGVDQIFGWLMYVIKVLQVSPFGT